MISSCHVPFIREIGPRQCHLECRAIRCKKRVRCRLRNTSSEYSFKIESRGAGPFSTHAGCAKLPACGGSWRYNPKTCHLEQARGSGATESASKDPEDGYTTMPIRGVSTHAGRATLVACATDSITSIASISSPAAPGKVESPLAGPGRKLGLELRFPGQSLAETP